MPVIISTSHSQVNFSPIFRLNFLVDTGASRTQISWNDANSKNIVIRLLPLGSIFTGLGSRVRGYNLPGCQLIFKSNIGTSRLSIDNLSISDYETIDGKPCPISPSLLGMDILDGFDFLSEPKYGRLYLRR